MKNQKLILSILLLGMFWKGYTQITPGTYTITTKLIDRRLDIKWADKNNGAGLHIWDPNGGEAQKFKVENSNEADYYYIKSEWGKCLTVNGSDPNILDMWDCVNGNNQKWKFIDTRDDHHNIQSKLGTYIDVRWGKKDNGSEVGMSGYSNWEGNVAQRWKMRSGIEDGLHFIQNANSGKFIGVGAGNRAERYAIQWGDVGQLAIFWGISHSTNSGQCIVNGVTGNWLRKEGNELVHYFGEGSNYFTFEKIGSNYKIKHTSSGKILGVENSSKSDGARIILFDDNVNPPSNCLWLLKKISFTSTIVKIKTGGDDLRGGNHVYIDFGNGKEKLSNDSGFGKNTTFEKVFPPQNPYKITIEHDGSPRSGNPFDTYDNWNLDMINVKLKTNHGKYYEILNINQLIRFTGDLRKKEFIRTNNIIEYRGCEVIIPG